MSFYGIALIVIGIIYIIKPGIFRRGLWKQTAITQRLLSPENYNIYMRILGSVLIIIGIVVQFTHH